MGSLCIPSSSLPPSITSPALSSVHYLLSHLSTSSGSVPLPDKRRDFSKVQAFICRNDVGNSWSPSVQDPGYKRVGLYTSSRVYVRNSWTRNHKLHDCSMRVLSKKINSPSEAENYSDDDDSGVKKNTRKSKQLSKARMKKLTPEDTGSDEPDEQADILGAELHKADTVEMSQKKSTSNSNETVKVRKKPRKKKENVEVESASVNEDEGTSSSHETVKVRKKPRKKKETVEVESASVEDEGINFKESKILNIAEAEKEELLLTEDTEDISFTYEWPPLVCCYGAALHAFVPSGRPANRLIDYSIHETMEDIFWCPTKFVRAPGGSSSGVALALAGLGGRVAFMGKVGDDAYGQCMLYHLNSNNVQTRSVKIDDSKPTAVSLMKISKRGSLKMTPVKSCAEDSLLISELSIDVIKEAKMFYFNSSSLLDLNTRKTTMHALKIAKKFGGMIFFDLNLPLPLWHSKDDTIMLIQQAWNYADIIELTKQELEFICGIKSTEKYDTKDNHHSKFLHHKPEVVMPLWHENLKVLFVTNGTSKIHYYTQRDNGWVRGMEDAPVTPFTADMSVSGDAIVAALMRMLTVQSDLVTDKGYLEHTIKYAINCGVTDQWVASRVLGFPPKEGINGVTHISEREYRTVGPDGD